MESPDYEYGTQPPIHEIRESFTPQTSDLRGSLPTPSFEMITMMDNGGVLNANTNEVMPPKFGNCC